LKLLNNFQKSLKLLNGFRTRTSRMKYVENRGTIFSTGFAISAKSRKKSGEGDLQSTITVRIL